MASHWFCKSGAHEIGPLTPAELRNRVAMGEVTASTLIRKDGSGWILASRVKGLFTEGTRLPPADGEYRSDDQQQLFARRAAFAAASIAAAVIVSSLSPALSLLVALALVALMSSYAANPTFRLKLEDRLPHYFRLPHSRLTIGSLCALSFLLCGMSVSMMRLHWKQQAHEERVTASLKRAFDSLNLGEVDEATRILRIIEDDHEMPDRSRTADLRQQIEEMTVKRTLIRANDKVTQCEIEGRRALLEQRVDIAENLLQEAFRQKDATDFGPAKRLAEAVMNERISSVRRLITAGDAETARNLLFETERLPGVEKARLSGLKTQAANLLVSKKVEQADAAFRQDQMDEADRLLKNAISTADATDLEAAKSLLKRVTIAKRKDTVDASNSVAFEHKRGVIRIGSYGSNGADDPGFNFKRYAKPCLTTVDKLINDRQQVIDVSAKQGVEVELRFDPMELNEDANENVTSHFEITPDAHLSHERVSPSLGGQATWNINSSRAIAYFIPSDYVPPQGGTVKLELFLKSPAGTSFTKSWFFNVRRPSSSATDF